MTDLLNPKIMTRDELRSFVEGKREQGYVLVTTNGTFDLLHVGHVKNLEEAKSLGDVLIVAVNSDESVKSYKGLDRPFLPAEERAYMLAALNCVDAVCIMDEVDVAKPLIELVKPDFHVKGKQYEGKCLEQEIVLATGGVMHFAEMIAGISTTDVARTVVEKVLAAKREQVLLVSSSELDHQFVGGP